MTGENGQPVVCFVRAKRFRAWPHHETDSGAQFISPTFQAKFALPRCHKPQIEIWQRWRRPVPFRFAMEPLRRLLNANRIEKHGNQMSR